MRERPLSFVPKAVTVLLLVAFALQLTWRHYAPTPQAQASNLAAPPSLPALEIASLAEPIALSKLLMLYVQAFDNQAGIRIPFQQLDYHHLQLWLTRILQLDPRAQYPLLSATNLYAGVSDDAKKRIMLDFVYRRFLEDPNHRWRAMADASVIARHKLKDLPLALKYAHAIKQYATGKNVPSWAQQMEIFLLEDMNEVDRAKILLGALLASGEITDPHELRFLNERLKTMGSTVRPQ